MGRVHPGGDFVKGEPQMKDEGSRVAVGIDAAVVANHHIVVRRPVAGGPGTVELSFTTPANSEARRTTMLDHRAIIDSPTRVPPSRSLPAPARIRLRPATRRRRVARRARAATSKDHSEGR